MELDDFRGLSDSLFETDLCIVGTGPAGLGIAHEFSDTKVRVLMIESGDVSPTPEAAALDAIDNVGAPRQLDQALVRTRAFGGTSGVWNGRCVALDPSDFEERSWVPLSGWPLSHAQLAPYYERAAVRLGLLPVAYDAALEARLPTALPEPASSPGDAGDIRSFCWQFSVDETDASTAARSSRSFRHRDPNNVRVLLHATATHLETDPVTGRIEWLEIRSLTGKIARIRSKVLVLCTGGIETPRLLLASRRAARTGVGNHHDLVGRYLMDHPRCTLGHFDLPAAQQVRAPFMLQRMDAAGRARYFARGLALSAQCQEREQLLSCSGWVNEHHSADDPWTSLKRLARGAPGTPWLRDFRTLVRQPRLAAAQLYRRVLRGLPVVHKIDGADFVCDVEQVPDPASRISLSDIQDSLGTPLARIDWKIGDAERQTLRRFGQLVVEAFQRMRLPAPQLRQNAKTGHFGVEDFIDVAHPSGTTRMASDPHRGVVDEHCEVHGVDRLFVVSTSVFPTNGHANPTLTLLALAIRLADRVKARYFERATPQVAQPESLPELVSLS